MSYHPVKFCGHKHSGNREITIFFCHMTLEDHVIRALYNLLVRVPSRYVTILPSFMAIGTIALKM